MSAPSAGDAVIRRAQVQDAPAMAACVRAAYAHYVARMGREPGPMLDDYAAVVREHDAWVLERAGRVTGLVVLIRRAGGLLLDNVAVDPAHRGAALGRTLLEFAEARAAQLGFAALDLYTHELMHENIAWYARHGYRETGRVTEEGFARVYMRKDLPRAAR